MTTKQLKELVPGTNSEEHLVVQEALNESVTSAAPWRRLMSLQSAEPAGVLEINRDEAAEISVAGAAGAGAVPVAGPVDAVHPVVVDEVEADGAAWPEILERVHFFRRKGEHDSGWSCFDRLAVSCPNREHVQCSRSRSVALQMDVLGRNARLCCLGVWLQVDGSGAQGIHARHWKYANVKRRNLFFFAVTSCGVWEPVRLKASQPA